MRIGDIGEMGLIREIAKGVRRDRRVIAGIGDDAAVVPWTGKKHLLLACDMLLEGVHFTRRTAAPYRIGWKAMARNVSDIAAMGGVPRYALVAAGLDPALPVSFAKELLRGMEAVGRRFGFTIVGGDTARSRKIVLDVSLVGEVEKRRLALRGGARPGDLVFVTGRIGGSRRGKHLSFTPRLDEARAITERFRVSAMIDISDGLLLDARRVLDASGVGARLFGNAIPLAGGAGPLDRAVTEGEDFELLFTMRPAVARRFCRTMLGRMKTPVTLIGMITGRRDGLVIATPQGDRKVRAAKTGFLHF